MKPNHSNEAGIRLAYWYRMDPTKMVDDSIAGKMTGRDEAKM